MTNDRDRQSTIEVGEVTEAGISRRRFAALSGATLLGSLLGAPARLAAMDRAPRRQPIRSAGTFDLRITMVGLCFFVPDERAGRMHVLMPKTSGHEGHGVKRHAIRLMYDAAHEQPGADGLAGEVASVSLEDAALDFAGLAGGLELAMADSVVDLSPIVRDGVGRDTLADDMEGRLRARLSFAAGRMSAPSPGLRWDLGPYRARRMSNAVEWTVPGISGDGIELLAKGLHGTAAPSLRPLHPVGGRVDLVLLHVPPEEMLPYGRARELPEPGFASADFAAYYGLFGSPADTPLPRLSGEDGVRAVRVALGGAAARDRVAFGGTPYTCLTGGGKPKGGS